MPLDVIVEQGSMGGVTRSETVSVRTGLPWLRSGPLWRVHTSAFGHLTDWLSEMDYIRVDLEGAVMTSRAAAHAEIGRAFGFPYWYGNSWDAFNDCMYQFARDHQDQRIAVVWHHMDQAAALAPATATEVGWALLDSHVGSTPSFKGSLPYAMALDVFAVGSTDDFDRAPSTSV